MTPVASAVQRLRSGSHHSSTRHKFRLAWQLHAAQNLSSKIMQRGATLVGREASLCRSVARARAPMTERQLAPTRRFDTRVRTR